MIQIRLRLVLKRDDGSLNRFNNDGPICNYDGGHSRRKDFVGYVLNQVVFLIQRQTLEPGEWTD